MEVNDREAPRRASVSRAHGRDQAGCADAWPGSFAELLLAAGRDDDTALVESTGTTSYRELRDAVRRISAALSGLGMPDGARIGVLASNSAFWVVCYLAAMTRWVAVPLSEKLTVSQARGQIGFAGCRAVCIDRRHLASHSAALGSLPVLTEAALSGSGQDLGKAADGIERVPGDPGRDAALVFTSGTTARPKAVRLTHRNFVANTDAIVSYLELERSDRMLVVLPFHYCFGASLLHTHLRVGASLALCNTFAFPQTAVALIESERCTGLAGVPSSFQLLLRASNFASAELPSLRLIQQAGGKLPEPQLLELAAAQPRAKLFVMYGQTEATARLSFLPPEHLVDKLGSIGRGIPGVRLEVLDERGRPVRPGAVGEIYASGESISPGYLDDPDATADKFPGGQLRTGDLATVDEDGFVYVVDRRDDFIKSWGHRVSSQEIESCVLQMPELLAAAAVGVPDDAAGEAIELFVVVGPGRQVSAQAVQGFLRARLARHMLPRHIHFEDALPMNANGKVTKAPLRSRAAELDDVPTPAQMMT